MPAPAPASRRRQPFASGGETGPRRDPRRTRRPAPKRSGSTAAATRHRAGKRCGSAPAVADRSGSSRLRVERAWRRTPATVAARRSGSRSRVHRGQFRSLPRLGRQAESSHALGFGGDTSMRRRRAAVPRRRTFVPLEPRGCRSQRQADRAASSISLASGGVGHRGCLRAGHRRVTVTRVAGARSRTTERSPSGQVIASAAGASPAGMPKCRRLVSPDR